MNRYLSKKDCICILELINQSLTCNNEDGFRYLIKSLALLIPFQYAICGISKLSPQGNISSYQILNYNYPPEWLDRYINQRYDRIDPVVCEHYASYKTQYWADTFHKHDQAREFISSARDFRLNDGYTAGLRDADNRGSIFTLSGSSIPRSRRTELILDILRPHLHQVLSRLLGKSDGQKHSLSVREMEVLNWLKHGKSSWEVSRILNISERTVNFHCSSVMHKLDAVSRSHALAIAIDRGIVSLD